MNYTELYKYLNKLYYQYFRYKTSISIELKKDIIQDVIISLYQKEKEGKLSSSIEKNKNYIFITLKNHITNKFTQKKHTSIVYCENIDIEDLIDEDDTEYQLDKESFLNQVNSLLDSIEITEEQREIFEMKFNDYSYQEIKDKLNVSKSRIANTINGTISKMKNEMNKKYYYKVVKIDGTSRYYFFKDLNQASKQARTYFGKAKKLIDDNGYAIINGWKIYK